MKMNYQVNFIIINTSSLGALHYLWSADLLKSFSRLIVSIWACQYLAFLHIFFQRFFSVDFKVKEREIKEKGELCTSKLQ